MQVKESVTSVHRLVQVVNEIPGSSAREISDYLHLSDTMATYVHQALYRLSNRKLSPPIKKIKQDGFLRYYPANYNLSAPKEAGRNITLKIADEPIRVTALTKDEVEKFKQKSRQSKYQELITVLESLEIGGGVAVPKVERIRHVVRDGFKGTEYKFSVETIGDRYLITRIS